MALPTGTVTFLFTDIEGSMSRWEKLPDGMRTALARHDALLREAIEANDGVVFKTIGDAFCAVFSDAASGLRAALNAQKALAAETWPVGLELRARMAIHTGTAECRDSDYFGPTLNRVARLLSIGHGGQTLLSETAFDLVRDHIPAGASVIDLGPHRLKDLVRPERVFQANHVALASDFPPVRSLDNPLLPNNLPQQVTSFVGREEAVEEVRSSLARNRLVTITGSGGCGKSRISLQVAADVLEHYKDGTWLIELAPLTDSSQVAQAVFGVFGLREEQGKPIANSLIEYFRQKQILLILDNCEHLLDACARLVNDLMRQCPEVRVLATSREGLGISGELTYRLPSMSLPAKPKLENAASLSQYEAVQLFVDRAVFHRADFAVTNANAAALAQLCVRLDGIPLAIELAAARIRSMSVEQVSQRLDDRFRILTGGSRTALPRQQTLRAAIDWSYDLLTPQERTLLRRLSVFSGGWTEEAVEAVCTDDSLEAWQVMDLIAALTDKSLTAYHEKAQSGRYQMLETVRQYARERLFESGEAETLRDRHRGFFSGFAEQGSSQLQGPEAALWLERLDADHENIRSALQWKCDAVAQKMASHLYGFWWIRGYLSEASELIEFLLSAMSDGGNTKERADFLRLIGAFASDQSNDDAAERYFQESLRIYRDVDDREGICEVQKRIAMIAASHGDFSRSKNLFEEALVISREIEDPFAAAHTLGMMGRALLIAREYGNATECFEEALTICREIKRDWFSIFLTWGLGQVALELGDIEEAKRLMELGLAMSRETDEPRAVSISLSALGDFWNEQCDPEKGRTLLEEGLAIQRKIGFKNSIAGSLSSLATGWMIEGDFSKAQDLLLECLAIRRELADRGGIFRTISQFADNFSRKGDLDVAATLWGFTATHAAPEYPVMWTVRRERRNLQIAEAKAKAGTDVFEAAWQKGCEVSIDDAVSLCTQRLPA